ncbi:MAG: DUF1836 domain-containing protein [Oscillospiraceae bacterium]|nr:DUF1836 domain-containing protein [Oscillospiraceae bacterium]
MESGKQALTEKMVMWESLAEETYLPAWDALPDFGLYMDQVVTLLEQYLHFLPSDKDEHIVSASAINNYVRLKIMPAPVKRKYYRVHLAYLLMILPMKQTVGIADISRILPPEADSDAIRAAYESYTAQFRKTAQYFNEQIHALAEQVESEESGKDTVNRLALESILLSSFARILSGQLIPPPPPAEKKGKEEKN